jgi:hypothetical protein
MQIIVSPLTNPENDDSLTNEFHALKTALEKTPNKKATPVVRELNLGAGADWIVFAIDLAIWTGAAIFTIPKAHKFVRESYEECKKIHSEILALIDKARGNRKVVRYPPEVLYLEALQAVLATLPKGEVQFLYHSPLPVSSDLVNGFLALEHHLFVFSTDSELKLIAIDSERQILWIRDIAQPAAPIHSTIQSVKIDASSK